MGETEPARTLMVQGATSSAGKSFLVAGLCRLLVRRGLRVAPFKSQNMALNSAVCPDGGEIGRSQAMQAQAAMVPAEVAMNPILLKPEGVDLAGGGPGPLARQRQRDGLSRDAGRALAAGHRSARRLRARFDAVVLEGAGSPAEMNLRQGEIVNMRVAAAARLPSCSPRTSNGAGSSRRCSARSTCSPPTSEPWCWTDRQRFRGDPRLFDGGVRFLEERRGCRCSGWSP